MEEKVNPKTTTAKNENEKLLYDQNGKSKEGKNKTTIMQNNIC